MPLSDAFLRFLIGGSVVSAFATLGGFFKPTSFAGLFDAAPSVALATIALTISRNGKAFAATECRSMMAGAAGLCPYSILVNRAPEPVAIVGCYGHAFRDAALAPDRFRTVVAFS